MFVVAGRVLAMRGLVFALGLVWRVVVVMALKA